MPTAEEIQRRYYTETASRYDELHGREPPHDVALQYIDAFITGLGLRSVLDVGTGTGRALRHFSETHPDVDVMGVEPVPALVDEAVSTHGVPAEQLVVAHGEQLPFPDESFDAVCEFAVLHHVRDPAPLVREMTRVARRAVFLSDENRFGHGSLPARLAKLALHRGRLWPLVDRVKTRGRGYLLSDEDGVSYSYSVFDSQAELAAWGDRVIAIPTEGGPARSRLGPLLTSSKVLLCAFREPATSISHTDLHP